MAKRSAFAVFTLLLVLFPILSRAQTSTPPAPQTIAEKTKDAQKLPGYFNLYWDSKQGKLWLEIDKWDTEFLYQSSLPAGIGSNDIGLDRGQLGATRVARFERSGPKILLVQENLDFRAATNDAAERRKIPASSWRRLTFSCATYTASRTRSAARNKAASTWKTPARRFIFPTRRIFL